MSTSRWPQASFTLITLALCLLAFVGLSVSSYWTDELFTLWVIGRSGGVGEVWQRALTDVHPPFYYLFLHAWAQFAGYSEFALRLPSALFSVAAVGVFALAARRIASTGAVAFACAAATLAPFWFFQSQNARSYGLCLLLVSALLSATLTLHARLRERPNIIPWLPLAAIAALALIGSFTHAYLLLLSGSLLLYVLCTEKNAKLRVAVIAIGLFVLALNIAYYRALTQDTHLDLSRLWFRNDGQFYGEQLVRALKNVSTIQLTLAALALAIVRALRRRAPATTNGDGPDARWATRLCIFVPLGVAVCGIAVSALVAPSFSDRNLLTTAPFLWLLFARGFDAAARMLPARGTAWGALALLVSGLGLLHGRWLPRNEEWRASAEFIRATPGCTDQVLPIVFMHRFGPPTPAMYALVEGHFFRHYAAAEMRLHAYLPAEFADADRESALQASLEERMRDAAAGGCPVLAWGVHDVGEEGAIRLAADLARRAGAAQESIVIREFDHYDWHRNRWRPEPGAYVFLLGTAPALSACSPNDGSHCNDIVVRRVCSDRDAASACAADGYAVRGNVAANDSPENVLIVRRTAAGHSEQRFGKLESSSDSQLCRAESSNCGSAESSKK